MQHEAHERVGRCVNRFETELAALVPPPRAHLLTYHGVLEPASALRSAIVPGAGRSARPRRPLRSGQEGRGGPCAAPHARRYPWAALRKRVFTVDVLHCEGCGGRRVILAAITQAAVVAAILISLGLPTALPVRHPARPPPGYEW